MRTLLTSLCFILTAAAQAPAPRVARQSEPLPQASRAPRQAEPSAQPEPSEQPKETKPKAPSFVDLEPPRLVAYSPQEIITVNTHVRFMTVIVLPMGEKVIDSYCGDTDFWKIDLVENLIYVKPVKAWISTDLTLLGKSGTLYAFYLKEVDQQHDVKPDVKVTISFNEPQRQQIAASGPRFISKGDFDTVVQDYQQQIADKEVKTREMKQAADKALTQMRLDYPAQLNFDYTVTLNTAPFFVTAMYADTRFTYIRLEAQEIPAVYEIKDGKPSLVNYDLINGTYIVRKIVDQGYLAIGKAKLHFSRKTK